MQVDPDQREWLYNEEQERLRWKRKFEQPSGTHWILGAATGVILLVIVLVAVSSDTLGEILERFSR